MLLWYIKENGSYVLQKSPSKYAIDYEDLDNNTYRSINSGDLIDTVVSYSWSKIKLSYNYLTATEVKALLPKLQQNPLEIKAKNLIFGNDYVEMKMRCSRKNIEMLEDGGYTLSFNLVQKKKVTGQ